MTFKELVSTISNENDIPAGTVRKVAKAVAESIKASVESGDELKLPGLKFKTVVEVRLGKRQRAKTLGRRKKPPSSNCPREEKRY